MHIIDQGKDPKEEFLNSLFMKQILQLRLLILLEWSTKSKGLGK